MDLVSLIVTTSFGLEAVVRRELEALGIKDITGADGKLEFKAALADIPRLNLWLRAADRVLIKVGEFSATDFGQLFDRTKELPWEQWIPADAKLTVIGKCVRSQLASVRSSQSIVHKALLERLKDKLNVEDFPETGAEFTVQVALLKDVAQLTIDTTGPGLHKRGYREDKGEVPLRENMAAALVLLSFWDKDRLLVDPMCGSGTILIEAAMIARNIAPGLKRKFAAESWSLIAPALWAQERQKAQAAIIKEGALQMFGYDLDPERIKDAKANARRAGVDKDIVFEQKDIKDLWIDKQYGIVITNPPWGVKLGSLKELTPLYVIIHQMFKTKAGWSLYVLTADERFPDFFKRAKPDRVRKLFNGTVAVNYYQYYGKRPGSDGSVKSSMKDSF